jgi:hypothetical protein
MADNDGPLAKFRGVLPSRAKLAQLSLFGTTEEARSSAQALLDILPEMTVNERAEYMNETWRLANTLSGADMEKSPAGRATLELIKNSKPMGEEVQAKAEGTIAPEPEPPAGEQPAPPEPAVESTNEYMAKLNWPPRPTPKAKDPIDDTPHKWQAGIPSKPDTSQKPISDDDFANNAPLY